MSDLRWAFRMVRQRPAFATTITLTLAGGIAAVMTTFGVARAVLWRQLPFTRPDQLVFVWENTGSNGGMAAARVTGYRFTEWQRESRTLVSAALFGAVGFAADRSGATEIVNG